MSTPDNSDVVEWLRHLTDGTLRRAHSDQERLTIVQDLLRHKVGDEMSLDDIQMCRRAERMLRSALLHHLPLFQERCHEIYRHPVEDDDDEPIVERETEAAVEAVLRAFGARSAGTPVEADLPHNG